MCHPIWAQTLEKRGSQFGVGLTLGEDFGTWCGEYRHRRGGTGSYGDSEEGVYAVDKGWAKLNDFTM